MFSTCICIIKKNTGGLWRYPGMALPEKVFRLVRYVLKESNYPQTTLMKLFLCNCFIYCYIIFYMLFSTLSSLNLVGFRLLIPTLSTWFSHSHFPLFLSQELSSTLWCSGLHSLLFIYQVVFIFIVSTRLRLLRYYVFLLVTVFEIFRYCIIVFIVPTQLLSQWSFSIDDDMLF